MKKNPKQSSPSPASANAQGPQATPPAGRSPRPNGWSQTGGLILLAWIALVIFGFLWRLWSGNGIIIFMSIFLIGLCFTIAAIFDHFQHHKSE